MIAGHLFTGLGGTCSCGRKLSEIRDAVEKMFEIGRV
jgi:hypothetical protein